MSLYQINKFSIDGLTQQYKEQKRFLEYIDEKGLLQAVEDSTSRGAVLHLLLIKKGGACWGSEHQAALTAVVTRCLSSSSPGNPHVSFLSFLSSCSPILGAFPFSCNVVFFCFSLHFQYLCCLIISSTYFFSVPFVHFFTSYQRSLANKFRCFSPKAKCLLVIK